MMELSTLAQEGKMRRSEARNFRSLFELCIDKVVHSMDLLSQTAEPFIHLPPSLLGEVVDALESRLGSELEMAFRDTRCLSPSEARALIGYNLPRLPLKTKNWSAEEVATILCLLGNKSQDCLRSLKLEPRPPLVQLHALLLQLGGLTELTVSSSFFVTSEPVGDNTLAIIGSTMVNLRSLTVSPSNVTEVGLRYLCVDDGVHGKCKQLEAIGFGRAHNDLKASDLLVLLENLPHLHTIDLYGNSSPVFNAVLLYARKHPGSPPLTEAKGNFDVSSSMKLADWKLFCSVMPKVKKISMDGFDFPLMRLHHLKSLEDFRILDFTVDLPYPINFQYHSSLTTLEVYLPDTRVDVSIIAEFCPNLIHLRLDVISTETNKYSFEGKLTKVEGFRTLMTCPDACIQAILFSKHLRRALLSSLMMNSPDLFEPVFTRAEHDREVLAQLSTLHLNNARCVNTEVLQRFVCLSPRLSVLNYHFFQKEREREFQAFLVASQLDRGLTLVTQETLH